MLPKRLTEQSKSGGYRSRIVALTPEEHAARYIKERNRLGMYEDSGLLPGELPTIKCCDCDYMQINDKAKCFCHSWHRVTDYDGFCYRSIPKKEKT